MPVNVENFDDLAPGDLYEDGAFHPCLCVRVFQGGVTGISLVDGSYPRSADIGVSGVRKLTPEEAWRWRLKGPDDEEIPSASRWW